MHLVSILFAAFLLVGVSAMDSTTTKTIAKLDDKESTKNMPEPRLTTSEEKAKDKQTITKQPTTNDTTPRNGTMNDTTVLPITSSEGELCSGSNIGFGIGISLVIIAIVSIAAACFGWKYYKKGYRFPYFWREPVADAKPANDKSITEPAFAEESQKNQMEYARNV
ncbi:unnamed protein product, partial [Mesorhabditis belari]|uniref:Uncharacterized protein n=1 Tax=Mesorhabditis belari TaxID=2138241 RepID=A0AAF3J492_9BILA